MAAPRAVFLDRDGVLNRAIVRDGRPFAPARVEDLEILPEARTACALLRAAGFLLIGVTNQPDIARGTQTIEAVEEIHRLLQRELGLDAIRFCPHDDTDRCSCRKPAPGLLLEEASLRNIDLSASYMVGDRWKDTEAGQRAGCRTIFINRGYREPRGSGCDFEAADLREAALWILERGTPMDRQTDWKTRIFADGADLPSMLRLASDPRICGFTTNPTLMRKVGVTDYERFAREVLAGIPDRPISFEVFADTLDDMERQGLRIAGWGGNVYVKVPVTNTAGLSTAPVIRSLASRGAKVNVTAVLTLDQVQDTIQALEGAPSAFISVFAGRIADTGRDPVPIMAAAVEMLKSRSNLELIWASPREILNLVQANAIGCHIITLTPDLLGKLPLFGKSLEEFSLETVQMFHRDAQAAGLKLDTLPDPSDE